MTSTEINVTSATALQNHIAQTIKTLDYSIDRTNLFKGATHILLNVFPDWSEQELEFFEITSGLTNKLVKVTNKKTGFEALVRTYGNNSEIFIDREKEILNVVALSILGFAVPLYAKFNNGTVYGYIPGEAFAQHDLKDPNKSALVAKHLAKLHRVNIAGPKKPILFDKIRVWLNQGVLPRRTTRKKQLSGEHENSVAFIDFEYGGYNYRGFDIGNHFNTFAGWQCDYSLYPTKEFQLVWLRHYLSSFHPETEVTDAEVEDLYREVAKFRLASLFYCSVWTLLSSEISDIKYDFMEYAVRALREYYQIRDEVLAL
ncbi:2731_t:CDS:2 [Ambispora gerdemannii]|uniref:ethanolamine kinase n=1 Tax=Ambispora gerdemannii TaxID=144530 RepID=A0A9N9DR15_9GLOM|nr:2731_t:CDS:2 [Ambispora gerdemannii]